MDQDFVSFQPILCHPQTQIRIILFDDEQRDIPNLEFSPSHVSTVSWDESSEVTKVPLTESRRLIVMESKVVGVHGEEGQVKDGEVQGEVKRVEQLRDNRTSWMVWRWDDGLKRP